MTRPYFRDLTVELIQQSIILLDIDGTLLPDGAQELDELTTIAVKKLAAQNNTIYLVSNGFSHKLERNRSIAKQLNITYYETPYKKPLKMAVLPLIKDTEVPVVVIGDKFITDGLLAINLRVPYIPIRSLRSSSDPVYSRIGYLIDAVGEKLFGTWARPPYYYAALCGSTTSEILTVLTRRPFKWITLPAVITSYAKIVAKKFLFLITRKPSYLAIGGARSVAQSLRRGLADLNIAHHFDPWEHQMTATVGVISGVDTLLYAIDQKKRGFIKTIVAGPNIVVAPTDENNLIKNQFIDKVVVPSEWNKKWWLTFDQMFESRAVVWPAGVDDRGGARNAKGVCIVYSKNADEKLFNKIIEVLWTHKLPIVVSNYGQFRQEEYFHLLKNARMIVYLSTHESQGIALNEAWMADIPTLVWNRGFFEYQGKRFENPRVGAPYLEHECGLSFAGDDDFERKLIEFIEKYDEFRPRDYSLAHFTNAICARKYLDIVKME